jgi:hypothetical protein
VRDEQRSLSTLDAFDAAGDKKLPSRHWTAAHDLDERHEWRNKSSRWGNMDFNGLADFNRVISVEQDTRPTQVAADRIESHVIVNQLAVYPAPDRKAAEASRINSRHELNRGKTRRNPALQRHFNA